MKTLPDRSFVIRTLLVLSILAANAATNAPATRAATVAATIGPVSALAARAGHTCAVDLAGGLKCWGMNDQGEVGDGSTLDRLAPVDVTTLNANTKMVATGDSSTCALTLGGGVMCWGDNTFGQIGDGTNISRSLPTQVPGLTANITAVASGANHTCVIATGGTVKCWGANYLHQVEPGATTPRTSPVTIAGLSGVTALALGDGHTCALMTAGTVQCWGSGTAGELGDGLNTERGTPAPVPGLSGVTMMAAGASHTCTVSTLGAVNCWGDNSGGQLGDGSTNPHPTPNAVPSLTSGVTALTAGGGSTCVIRVDGHVSCWGLNGFGQLGDGTTTDAHAPVAVLDISAATAVITSGSHTCAQDAVGATKCWGYNANGQLGNYTRTDHHSAGFVIGLGGPVRSVATGADFTCVLLSTSGVKCWGANTFGQLGDGSVNQRLTPDYVSGLTTGAVAITAGFYHACALLTGGGIKCWGSNDSKQLGQTGFTQALIPVTPTGLDSGAVSVSAGGVHTCALMQGGGVKCWGGNSDGELGIGGTSLSEAVPQDVPNLPNGASSVVAGSLNTCAILTTRGLKCWGYNFYGAVGYGSASNLPIVTPVDVLGMTDVSQVSVGNSFVCALTNSQVAKCWGYNVDANLGDGSTNNSPAPVTVAVLGATPVMIRAGLQSACALLITGAVRCWGDNSLAQLGDGTSAGDTAFSSARKNGVTVQGLMGGVAQLSVTGAAHIVLMVGFFGAHTCAVSIAGALQCWGLNSNGQLGSGAVNATVTTVMVTAYKADQTLAVPQIANHALNSPAFDVGAVTSSGLPVTVVSNSTGVCTVSGTLVTIVAVGTCQLAINAAGDPQFNGAQVTRFFTVAKTVISSGSHQVSLPLLMR